MKKRLKDMTPDERRERLTFLRKQRRLRARLQLPIEHALNDEEMVSYLLMTINACLVGDLKSLCHKLNVGGLTSSKLEELLTKKDALWTAYFLLKMRTQAFHDLKDARKIEDLTSAYELLKSGVPFGEHLLSLQSDALIDRDKAIKRIEDKAKDKADKAQARAEAKALANKAWYASKTPEELKAMNEKRKAIREEKKLKREEERFWQDQYESPIVRQHRDHVQLYSNRNLPLSIDFIEGRFRVVSTPRRTMKRLGSQEITTCSKTLKDALKRHWEKCYKAIKEHDKAQA